MKQQLIAAALSCAALAYTGTAATDDRLVSFDGGIGVIPARVGGQANTVRGVNPGGQVWVISRLHADVRIDGRISVDGRGLLLGGGENIGTNGVQSVHARLFCGPAASATAHNSGTVALEANGDFRIDDVLSPGVPRECASPVLLIVQGLAPAGNWFAAGIPKQ